ncbi:hypothetical protein K438DRAFT_2153316 [Mycena galopus ATCC 62051]|nr:hypothetical protein K438DRAFT_2153316 [Mycena galopus ATCC 62051]
MTAGFSLKSIKAAIFAEFMPTLEEDDEVMHIVPWDEDEKHLPLNEQGDVAVMVDVDVVPLVKVNNSNAYHKAVTDEAAKEKKERERKKKRERKEKGKTKKQWGRPLPLPQRGSPLPQRRSPSPCRHYNHCDVPWYSGSSYDLPRVDAPPPRYPYLPTRPDSRFPQEYAQPLDYAYHTYIPPHGYLPDVARYKYEYPLPSGGVMNHPGSASPLSFFGFHYIPFWE